MATPSELARLRTELDHDQTEHLQRLLGSWSLLADLSFSDLLLVAPVSSPPPGTGPQLVVLGQVRPNNRSTLISQDLVGQTVFEQRWDLAAEALHTGRLVKGSMFDTELDEAVPVWNVPVRHRNVVIGVLVRIQGPLRGTASMYERRHPGSAMAPSSSMVTDASSSPHRMPSMPCIVSGSSRHLMAVASTGSGSMPTWSSWRSSQGARWSRRSSAVRMSRSSRTACHCSRLARSPGHSSCSVT